MFDNTFKRTLAFIHELLVRDATSLNEPVLAKDML